MSTGLRGLAERVELLRSLAERRSEATLVRLGVDLVIGMSIGLAVIVWSPRDFCVTGFDERVVRPAVAWLEGSPAGFQMNRNLAHFMSTLAVTVWQTVVYVVVKVGGHLTRVETPARRVG